MEPARAALTLESGPPAHDHGRMVAPDLETDVVDADVRARALARFRERKIALPTFEELAHPERVPEPIRARLAHVDPDASDPLNLFRVHWHNGPDRRGTVRVPAHVVVPPELSGVRAPILVALGDRFPMIGAHKVLAAYACLVPRLVTGRFDPTAQKAIWPSTGNYCRGGVAIARILGCRGVAVLPEGMSAERFEWLARRVADPSDVVRTPGTESNVKEIYDECKRLAASPENVVLNQFSEYGNHLAHRLCTGLALESIVRAERERRGGLELAAFVSATGSAGTLGAGDHLKDELGARVVAAEALECPTLLYNGYGEHNIQGIGDKHVPLIHNVTNTDVVVAVSDRASDRLHVLFHTPAGREHLVRERGLDPALVDAFEHFGLSSLANLVASIQLAKALDLGPNEAVATVATDGAALYASEIDKALAKHFPRGFGAAEARATFEEELAGAAPEHLLELSDRDRDRIFNLGYFTWVEQQGVALADFERRRSQSFWQGLRALVPAWDERIRAFDEETGVRATLL